ncbi:hypothetical protein M885DRAFT_518656 [Pelagophyceae sp. CCMP2097]|nr:hypothetical protein M885DRAFT_518656 [Pelagophyceae sp. CCMP2097]
MASKEEPGTTPAVAAPAPRGPPPQPTEVPLLADDPDCGFCVYMRAGPCGDDFRGWEACVKDKQAAGEDFARLCIPVTRALSKCMLEHKAYYDMPDAPADGAPQ